MSHIWSIYPCCSDVWSSKIKYLSWPEIRSNLKANGLMPWIPCRVLATATVTVKTSHPLFCIPTADLSAVSSREHEKGVTSEGVQGQVPEYLRRKLMNSCPRRKHHCNPLFQQFVPYLISFITFLLLRMFPLIEKFALIADRVFLALLFIGCKRVTAN